VRLLEAFKGRNVIVEVSEGNGPLDQPGLKLRGAASAVQRFPAATPDGQPAWELMEFEVSFPPDTRFAGSRVVLAVRDEDHSFDELFRGTSVVVKILLYGSGETLTGRGSGLLRFAREENRT